MHHYIEVSGHLLPSYGLIMLVSAIMLFLVAIPYTKKLKLKLSSLFIIEITGGIGGYIGAKILSYLIKVLAFSRNEELSKPTFENSGYAVYGAILLGMGIVIFVGSVMKINYQQYLNEYLFMASLFLAVAKIGCYLSGCCYGIFYEGYLSVSFPSGVEAPSGLSLFPVQLLDSFIFIVITIVLFINKLMKDSHRAQYLFIAIYSPLRFISDFLRGDNSGKKIIGLSISQWIALICSTYVLIKGLTNIQEKKGSTEDVK